MERRSRTCQVGGPTGGSFVIGAKAPLTIIAGPCVIEDRETMRRIARTMQDACNESGLRFIFKASFDKANRSSVTSARGPGIDRGLDALADIRETFRVPITTDLHEPSQAESVARVVDLLQIPAFLCRQTDLLLAAAAAASRFERAVNVKKGQFVSPDEMKGPIGKIASAGCKDLLLTERGTFFGYQRLVNDFIGVGDLMEADWGFDCVPAVCFDCTHSAQLPGAGAGVTAGRRDRVPLLARAAAAAGVDAIFMECHPDPDRALSDASTMLRLDDARGLIPVLARIASLTRAVE